MNVKGWCVLECIFFCKTMKETFLQPSLIIRQLGLHANGHNIVDQQLPTLIAGCYMLLRKVCNWVKLFSQQLSTFLLFPDRRTVAQQCWMRLHSFSNIVGATHTHYAWFTKTYRLYPSHDALRVPTLLGVVASICTPFPTRRQKIPTLLEQQCWELLHPFACSLK